VINDLKKCGYKKDNCELNYKFLNNLQSEWKQYGTLIRQTKNLIDINIDALYNILKQNQGDMNDALGYKKKVVVITSDPLALVAEKIKVVKRKEKVIVSSDSKGSGADDFSELKNITALLAKALNRRKFYSKLTNNNLRASSTSQSTNKKQEFVKSDDKKEDKKADEKKRDMSKVKCYNCKKEGHFAKDKIIIDLEDEVVSLLEKEKANLKTIVSLKSKGYESSENAISKSENQSENDCLVTEKERDKVENPKNGENLDTFNSVRRPKHSGVIWKKKGSSNTSNANLSFDSLSNLNKNVKRYSRKDLLSCNNSHLGETSSAYVCNDAMNVSRMCDLFDDNNFFIFDDESIRISSVSKMPFRKKPCVSINECSKSNSNKYLPRTVHKWLPKLQTLAEPVAKWIPRVKRCSKHMTGNRALLTNFVEKFLGTVRFGNNDFAVIAGYGDVVIGSMTIKKIHGSVNVNFDEISEMASKQFNLEPGLSKLNETRKSSNPSVSQVSEASRKDLEDLFHNFYDEYFDSSKIMKSSTTNAESSNVEIPSQEEEVFNEVYESFQGESSLSSLNDDVKQSPEEVILPPTNTQSISNNMIPNGDEASTSHNVFNECLEDAYFDVSTSFHDPSNVHT
nr:integrase, catalytic region, zinc finger, CCHC-type, peptidase aspartic, catalytic [Tanacetum cinerariifolium]